jgi:capsular exopolysaccharide synthesis family protein
MAEASRVVQAAENEYKTAQAQETSVLTALEAVKDEAEDLSRRSQQYDTRKRELDAGNAVLGTLLSRAKETDVTQELRASNIRVVDPATVPRSPDRPNRKHDFVLGIVLGLGISLGLALLLDHLDASIRTADDVRRVLETPLFAVIPEAESNTAPDGGLVLKLGGDRPSDHFFEGYRVLRTALQYCWPDPGPRVVLVTSTLPGEGKTLTSVNLSRSLAAMEARVLLVDCDLRKSQIHTLLERPRTPGLSDLLVGKAEPEDAIQNEPGTTFDFLPAGTPVPSPADLITGASLKRLIELLRTQYDWVILDTPPVGAVADPLILAPHADGALVVVAAGLVHRSAARETSRRLAGTGVRVLGALLNRARREHHSYYYYSYYHGRGYGQPEQPNEERQPTLSR